MSMKRMMLVSALAVILGGTGLVPSVNAAVSVTDVKAVQRYPWNGLVDIDYTVVCDDANADVYVFPEGTDNDTGARLQMRTLTGEGANGTVKAGTHRMTWNAAKDMPNYHTPSFSVKMTAIRGVAPFIVIDLSGGADAASYPVRFSAAGPDLTSDTCRTTELWLRLILPGTFTMGSPSTELGRQSRGETQHSVTISKPFYMAVFETTQKQWQLVTGGTPSRYRGDTRPVDAVFDTDIRGSYVGANWPSHGQVDADSFLGKVRARTSLNLDLPTEAQWEYACRAGTTTALNNGKDLGNTDQDAAMAEVGRYSYNMSDGMGGYSSYHTKVGSYAPNAWGLYDMHGNVAEHCLDWYQDNLGSSNVTDPIGPVSGSWRVTRGGTWHEGAECCRSAYRCNDYGPGLSGFRLACSAGQ
ncbi:MAG: formylglycine-generating enzyme family protein [Kiritimatiellae bacterium]|nr:formylglycine-generating enzyme family protein [Kiritimatiellia bacterium]